MKLELFLVAFDCGDGSSVVDIFFLRSHADLLLAAEEEYRLAEDGIRILLMEIPDGIATINNVLTPVMSLRERWCESKLTQDLRAMISKEHIEKSSLAVVEDRGNLKHLILKEKFGNIEIVNNFYWNTEMHGEYSEENFWKRLGLTEECLSGL